MAGASQELPSPEASIHTIRRCLTRRGHVEEITIHAEPFSRHNDTFHDCSGESRPCCAAAFPEDEVDGFIQEECDKAFGPRRWISSGFKRRSPVESANVVCHQYPPSGELSDDQGGSDTAARTLEPDQDRTKRRRTEKSLRNSPPDTAACELPDEAASSDPITEFAHQYYQKVLRGMKKLDKIRNHNSTGDLGQQLVELRGTREKDEGFSGKALEELLKNYSSNSQSDAWLANLYSLYAGIQGRSVDKAHSETGNSDKEQRLLKKEAMCLVTSEVVNNLQESWGASTSLIYNALRETKHKGSALANGTGIGRGLLGETAKKITELFLKKGFEFKIKKDTPVVNPAFFLALINPNVRYEEVCRSIKLDRFAELQLQAEIDEHVASLPNLAINAGQIPYSTLLQKEGGTGTWVELDDSGNLWTVRLLPRGKPQGGNLSSGTELSLQEPPMTQDERRGYVCASPSSPSLGDTDAGTMRDQHSGRGLSPPTSQGQMFVDTHFRTPPDTSHGIGQPSILGFQAINRGDRSELATLLHGSDTRHRSEPEPNRFQDAVYTSQGNRAPEGSSPAATPSEQDSNLMELSVGGTRHSLPGNTSAASRSPWREVMGLGTASQPTVIIHPSNSGATIHGIPAFNDIQHRSGHTLQHQEEVGKHDGASRPTQQGNSPFGTHEPIDMLVQAALLSDSGTSSSTVQPVGGLGPISYLMLTGELAGTPGGPFINAEGSEWGVSQRNGSRRPSVGAEHVWQSAGDSRSEYSLRDGGMVDAQELGRHLFDMEHFIVWPENENIGEMDGAPEATSGIVI